MNPSAPPPPPRLLDQLRRACRLRHFSRRTEDAYCLWTRRFIVFHDKQHPARLGPTDVTRFLSWLAPTRHVSASTQNQALAALLFLYANVLERPLPHISGIVRARAATRLPVVLRRAEIRAVLDRLSGVPWIVAALLYGAGLRLRECLELRVKDVDLERRTITVRQGKGAKDRITMLPAFVVARLNNHLAHVRRTHETDLAAGFGRVVLPDALAAKYPNAERSRPWQFAFPASRICTDRRWGARLAIPPS